jgi:hypothetical protein
MASEQRKVQERESAFRAPPCVAQLLLACLQCNYQLRPENWTCTLRHNFFLTAVTAPPDRAGRLGRLHSLLALAVVVCGVGRVVLLTVHHQAGD